MDDFIRLHSTSPGPTELNVFSASLFNSNIDRQTLDNNTVKSVLKVSGRKGYSKRVSSCRCGYRYLLWFFIYFFFDYCSDTTRDTNRSARSWKLVTGVWKRNLKELGVVYKLVKAHQPLGPIIWGYWGMFVSALGLVWLSLINHLASVTCRRMECSQAGSRILLDGPRWCMYRHGFSCEHSVSSTIHLLHCVTTLRKHGDGGQIKPAPRLWLEIQWAVVWL